LICIPRFYWERTAIVNLRRMSATAIRLLRRWLRFANTNGGNILIGALDDWPNIEFVDDQDGCLFTATVMRKPIAELDLVEVKPTSLKSGGAMGGAIGGAMGGSVDLTNRQKEIVSIIRGNSKISYRAMASILKINESAVIKHLNTLKTKGFLKRIGGTRGYWEVLKIDDKQESQ